MTVMDGNVLGCCPMDCPDTCSWVVTVKDGKAIKLRGSAAHPITRGALCAKMNDYISFTQHPDRLLYPLRRLGAKGEGRFERITWDEALDEIARRFSGIIADYGAEAIWPYLGCGSYGILQGLFGSGKRFWNCLGASQHVVTICTISGNVGTGYTIGEPRIGMDPESVRHARLIVLWGTNTLTTNMHFWRPIEEARSKGAHLVVIDPVRTRTAEQADEHVAPIPGTDAALALGLLNVLLRRGAEDREFIARHTLGWDAFRERILEYDPERVASITGVPVPTIQALGERLAQSRPTAIKTMMGLQRHAGGGMALRTISCIPGVTGDWARLGGGVSYDTRGFFKANWAGLLREDLRPHPVRALHMTRLGDNLLELTDPPVMALFLQAANPMASNPNTGRLRQALSRPDLFMVAYEQFMTDSARYADIVLPSTAQLEHTDMHNAYGHVYLGWNEPAVSPPGECMASTEFFRRLATRMGLSEQCLFDSDEEMARQLLASGARELEGITLEGLKQNGFMRLNLPREEPTFVDGFPTPSGKLEFYSQAMERAGLDPVAGYTPPVEAVQAGTALACAYPLTLIAAARHFGLNSMFMNSDRHAKRQGVHTVSIHPDDAKPRGIESGMVVRVFNDRGDFHMVADVTDKVRRGVLGTVKSGWPSLDPFRSTPNATVAERDSDMGGGATFHDNRVEIQVASEDSPSGSCGFAP